MLIGRGQVWGHSVERWVAVHGEDEIDFILVRHVRSGVLEREERCGRLI